MKTTRQSILLSLFVGLLSACTSNGGTGDSETHWLKCVESPDCPHGDVCELGICIPARAPASPRLRDGGVEMDANDSPDAALEGGGVDAEAKKDASARDGSTASHGSLDAGPIAEGGSGALLDGGRISCPVGSMDNGGTCLPTRSLRLSVGFAECQIKDDNTLWCWGSGAGAYPSWQQPRFPEQVETASDWKTIDVGSSSACGLKNDGTAWCFGRLSTGVGASPWKDQQTPAAPSTDSDWQSVSAGGIASCGVKKDGSLWCWGSLALIGVGDGGITVVPGQFGDDFDWALVRASSSTICAIKKTGALYCLGDNSSGELGDGTTDPRLVLTAVQGGGSYAEVAPGDEMTCGLRTDGTLWCWGYRFDSKPIQVGTSNDWVQLAGQGNVCGMHADGTAQCFGGASKPTTVETTTRYESLGGSCAEASDGTIECWASSARGDGNDNVIIAPVRVGTDSDWTDMSIRWQGALGLHAGGKLDAPSQPADGTTAWLHVAYSGGIECAIRSDHALFCWGQSFGATNAPYAPVQVGTATDWSAVAIAYYNGWTCGIRATGGTGPGALWCWYPGLTPDPFQVDASAQYATIAGGQDTMCGVRADGSMECWKMTYGDCGGKWCAVPQLSSVGSDHDWASVAVGKSHFCGIKTDASLWCWGTNVMGELGTGMPAQHSGAAPTTVPGQVAPGTKWAEVAAGDFWTCGIKTDASLWCWGTDINGELGLGFPGASRHVPEQVGTLSDWQHIATSGGADAFSCGIRQGQLWCWGENQLDLVTRTIIDRSLAAKVVDGPPGTPPFCAYPHDNDFDGYADCYGDCDDTDPNVSPYATELCNGKDDNCDGRTDEGCP